ncbi:acyltransferase [Microvirga sp. 3-52]|uniref:acyltransferase family protein n=1 Tax=Microvirga sp. 3-52 TaxID=2792425 RepID=UPI001AD4D2B4|nr:acyltransferase family protein [Microvirga sp. 3-52]MBO1904813.1 acyltransferase [Microvirga sp. 3-52]MBS7452393.1 acyltransferase [Microvirga sp. 3-52]
MKSPDEGLREQIDILRFLLVFGLVFLHYGKFPGYSHDPWEGLILNDHPIATFTNSYFYFFFLSSVPLLSAISGYLFFREADYSASFFLRRYRSRTRSVLLPMISWNAISLAVAAIVLSLYPNYGKILAYDVFNLRWQDIINAHIGLTQNPANFQFWFLRDLFLTVLCSPILAFLIKRIPWIAFSVLFVIWLLNWNAWHTFHRPDVLFFFYIGAMARIRNWPVATLVTPGTGVIALVALLGLVALRTLAPLFVPADLPLRQAFLDVWSDGLRLLGVVALWGVAPLLVTTYVGRMITKVAAIAFFLHALHWPLNQFMKAWFVRMFPDHSDFTLLLNFFGSSILSVLLTIAAAWALNALAPSVFDHLSGGRSRLWSSARNRVSTPVAEKLPQAGV